MQATLEVTEANFQEVVERDGIVLLDWWAPWCGPCRAFGPVFERVAANHPDVRFGKVNTEEQQSLAAAFQIRSIPTLMLVRDRVLLLAQPGALAEAELEELLAKARALDMEEVRAKLAEQDEGGEPEAG